MKRLGPRAAARELSRLFPLLFERLHRRGPKRTPLTPQGWAVLHHLSLTGPLTVTEAARHLGRAQSVMSEMIDHLEAKGFLARHRDTRDKRRTLVWLTDAGHQFLSLEGQVLCLQALETAFRRMSPEARHGLVEGLRALVQSATLHPNRKEKTR